MLQRWLAAGFLPVISPVSLGTAIPTTSTPIRSPVALRRQPARLVFISNVPGVLIDGAPASPDHRRDLATYASGQIAGGMIPKVRSAVDAVHDGVAEAVITNLAGCAAAAVRRSSPNGARRDVGHIADTTGLNHTTKSTGSAISDYRTMNTHQIIEQEEQYLMQVYARAPFVLDHGHGCTVVDTDGREYIDCVAGIAVNAPHMTTPICRRRSMPRPASYGVISNLYHTASGATGAVAVRNQLRRQGLLCQLRRQRQRKRVPTRSRRYAYDRARSVPAGGFAQTGPSSKRDRGVPRRLPRAPLRSLAATDRPKYQQPFEPLMPGVRFAQFNDPNSAAEAIAEDVCG